MEYMLLLELYLLMLVVTIALLVWIRTPRGKRWLDTGK